jgi:dihydropteroate synthase
MAIVNRTPDSFFDRGATFAEDAALAAVARAVAAGADIIDIGGVKAGPGAIVDTAEEIRRTIPTVEAVRARFPHVVISIDTWRAEVAERAVAAGADLLNDTWGGHDPALAEVAAATGAALVCSHAGGLRPRTRPHRVTFGDVVHDVVATVTGLAARAVALGVRRDGILIDPAHDFGKNTRHSLEITRRLAELTGTGWPVLVALSNKDFIGETLDAPVDARQLDTLTLGAVLQTRSSPVTQVGTPGVIRVGANIRTGPGIENSAAAVVPAGTKIIISCTIATPAGKWDKLSSPYQGLFVSATLVHSHRAARC